MDIRPLQSKVAHLESVLRARTSFYLARDLIARALMEIHATRSAHEVLSIIANLSPEGRHLANGSVYCGDRVGAERSFPAPDTVHEVAPLLFDAVVSGDSILIMKVLDEMGICDLCLPPNEMLNRLEFCVGCVVGRARLIALIELAIFTAELEERERTIKYLAEARILYPGPSELHDLCTVEGILALGEGNVQRADELLLESIRVCQEDEFARLACAVRVPNFVLADRLIDRGEREPVVKFLAECRKVWVYCADQIESWMENVRIGQRPDFLSLPIFAAMSRPARKFRILMIKASFLGDTIDKPETVLRNNGTSSGEMRAEFRRINKAAISGKQETGKN